MNRFTIALVAAFCTTAVQPALAAPSAGSTNDVDYIVRPTAVESQDHQWGASFNHTEWGLTDEDFNFDNNAAHDNSTTADWDDDELLELDARGKKVKKVGLAFDWFSPVNAAAWKNSNIRAAYNWDIWRPTNLPKGVPYWPMLHRAEKTKDWLNVCKKGYAKVALGPNEPDHPGQANMSPKAAAAIWRKYMIPLKKRGYFLISPAVTNGPSGAKWLREYKKICPQCWKTTDGLALHYYSRSAAGLRTYVTKMHKEFKKPVHITETACEDFSGTKCSTQQAANYMKAVTSFAMKTSWVRSIFYFGMWPKSKMPGGVATTNSLMDEQGRPNALGKKFLSY